MPHTLSRLAALLLTSFTATQVMAANVYVSNEKDHTLSVIDSNTLAVVKTIPVGKRPRGITLSKDGKSLFICASDDNTVQVMDLASGKITHNLPSGEDPEQFALAPDGKSLYIANENSNVVTIIDVASRRV
ncbi:MAG TPA: beta-propeller fold lactonase family protein, partial [Pseudogulbenkiania sp.]|nr:beta-propeller fold lactonase family protein [Pseudogulbenkiania sp.]